MNRYQNTSHPKFGNSHSNSFTEKKFKSKRSPHENGTITELEQVGAATVTIYPENPPIIDELVTQRKLRDFNNPSLDQEESNVLNNNLQQELNEIFPVDFASLYEQHHAGVRRLLLSRYVQSSDASFLSCTAEHQAALQSEAYALLKLDLMESLIHPLLPFEEMLLHKGACAPGTSDPERVAKPSEVISLWNKICPTALEWVHQLPGTEPPCSFCKWLVRVGNRPYAMEEREHFTKTLASLRSDPASTHGLLNASLPQKEAPLNLDTRTTSSVEVKRITKTPGDDKETATPREKRPREGCT